MAETTKIEWADATVNFWWGCTKVSPACRDCYAETLAKRWGKNVWGPGVPREDHRAGARKLAMKLERQAVREGRRLRVFCESMSDWLDHEVPAEWLADLLAVVAETPHLDWLLLTKRPELWRSRLDAVYEYDTAGGLAGPAEWLDWLDGKAPDNIWVGVTVEDQEHADVRIPQVLAIPARVRFLSMEPLLGPVKLPVSYAMPEGRPWIGDATPAVGGFNERRIDWIIAGGESGRRARPSHPDWFRSLRDQAASAGVPFHFKQWGEWQPAADIDVCDPIMATPVTSERYHALPGGGGMLRIGKANAGRELDGREWDELPEVARG